MTSSLLRRAAALFAAALAGAVAIVGTSAFAASAASQPWGENNVSGLSLLIEIVLIPLAIGGGIALVVWTMITAKERAAGKVPGGSSDES